MGTNIKLFNNHAEYNQFTQTSDFILPNVSHCILQNDVHYNPYKPKNIFTYFNQIKINDYYTHWNLIGAFYGINYNLFLDKDGNQLNVVEHTFENGVGTVVFDEDIASFGAAFYESEVDDLEIPPVETIEDQAFYNCPFLSKIVIPNTVQTISYQAFYNCNGITEVIFQNEPSINEIGEQAFYSCDNLSEITIPSTVTEIGSSAFLDCSKLLDVTILATTPPTLGNNVFDNNANGRKIYVPAESLNTYKAASGWSDYANDIYAL